MTEAEVDQAIERMVRLFDLATAAAREKRWQDALLLIQEVESIADKLPRKED
jgi:hypothetical protein